jgi:hypothetical protein
MGYGQRRVHVYGTRNPAAPKEEKKMKDKVNLAEKLSLIDDHWKWPGS